jgi:hypothetical protein
MSNSSKAVLIGAWYTALGPRFAAPRGRISYAFTGFGSYRLTIGTRTHYLDLGAPGFFTDVMKDGKRIDWESTGPAQFTDEDGDKLFAEAVAKDGVLWYQFDGGTGKWAKANGKIIVEDAFTHTSDTVIRAFEQGEGELTI